jgi:hypothetical protein
MHKYINLYIEKKYELSAIYKRYEKDNFKFATVYSKILTLAATTDDTNIQLALCNPRLLALIAVYTSYQGSLDDDFVCNFIYDVEKVLARNDNTDGKVLEILSANKNEQIRKYVASHENVYIETIIKMKEKETSENVLYYIKEKIKRSKR